MATQTENLGLTKPDAAEGYDINVFNGNADILDGAVGALLNELGGAGGGLGGKVDALQASMTAARSEIAAVKTDTAALVQALATANANIATLLTQTKGVKTIYTFRVTGAMTAGTPTAATVNIPDTINPDRIVLLLNNGNPAGNVTGIYWTRSGRTISIYAGNTTNIDGQIIEFY